MFKSSTLLWCAGGAGVLAVAVVAAVMLFKGPGHYAHLVPGETVAYVISKARFHAVLETMELLSNREFVDELRRYEAGETKWTALADAPR